VAIDGVEVEQVAALGAGVPLRFSVYGTPHAAVSLRIEGGWLRPNDAPGWGIDLDESEASRFPPGLSGHDAWAAKVRGLDGGLIAP